MDMSTATSSRKRTRLVAGCASCRERHVKCDSTLPKCRQCQKHGLECNRDVKVKFRYELSSDGPREQVFPASQSWVDVSGSLQYRDETSDIVRHYEDVSYEENARPGTMINIIQSNPTTIFLGDVEGDMANRDESAKAPGQVSGLGKDSGTAPTPAPAPPLPSLHENLCVGVSSPLLHNQPVQVLLSHESPASHPSHNSSSVLLTPRQDYFEPLTDREAELMRNFTENMALWVDVHDPDRHFEIEVPRRALSNTMLRYAIFSFSSRHLNRNIYQSDSEEALDYRHKALQLLIPQLSGPVEGLTEEHLAAVIILRLDEEMSTDDTQSHLAGATKILNSMASFGISGGLGEACAWTCLRQDIYICLNAQQPLRTHLENFDRSLWLQKDDDMSWTSKMILLLAKILKHAFSTRSPERSVALNNLSTQVEDWNSNKPLSFRPIKTVPRGKERDQRLPVIWMMSPFHVTGQQHYHIAKIVLLISLGHESTSSTGFFTNYHQSRKTEKVMREHLLTVLGLAVSNPKAENTLFQARHALAVWGGVLRHPFDQRAATEFLLFMRDRTAWNISKEMEALQELWHEDSE